MGRGGSDRPHRITEVGPDQDMKMMHATPSDPNYKRNLVAHLK